MRETDVGRNETGVMLEAENVCIRYKLGDFKDIGLKEWTMRHFTGNYHVHEFMAVQDVSFKIYKGDMLGIVGSNGAGKSTLLKAVAGIMEPTKGYVKSYGSVVALLELASGFDGNLTVKENAYLRGAMLGYTKKYMDEAYKYILDFSELWEFEDRPFKQLSSGMQSRLAFSIASMVQPEILILDEVLSVGDGAFQAKSAKKMREIIQNGATTILVSHSLTQIRELCNKVLWLHQGKQVMFGETNEVCNQYQGFLSRGSTINTSLSKAAFASGEKKYDYIIVGAGLFGAVFAHEATKYGMKCLVIDKRQHIGGNIYTEQIAGITIHKYGPHVFHTSNEEVWGYVTQLADFNRYIHSPIAVYKEEQYNLPFNMNTFNKLWGVRAPDDARRKIQEQNQIINTSEPRNLEEQALLMVGQNIYNKLIKGYAEKQWGRPCSELPPSIIEHFPLRFTYNNHYFDDKYQGIPIGGYTPMIQKLLEGSDILLNTSYSDYISKHPDVTSKIVYTGPIDEYYQYIFGPLEYRSLHFEVEELQIKDYQGTAVMCITDAETPYTRIIEHKHFEFGEQPSTVITREYPEEWKPGEEPFYPLSDDLNNRIYAKYKELAAKEENIIFGGRLGEYKYYQMDEVIASALDAIKKEFKL